MIVVEDGEVTWQATTIKVAASPSSGIVDFDGDIGAMTFGNDQQTVAIDGLTFVGQQSSTQYGFNVGDVDMRMGPMTINAGGMDVGGMQGLTVQAASSVDDGVASATMRMEMNGQTIPGFGDITVVADMNFDGMDAATLGVVARRLDSLAGTQDPNQIMMEAGEEFKDLLAAGLSIGVDQFDVTLPMGTVTTTMSFEVPASDRATFEWTSLLLDLVASIDISVPEALVQLASSMNPQAGALIGMGYLRKEGDVYILDADFKKGLLTINGAPVPVPLGMFN